MKAFIVFSTLCAMAAASSSYLVPSILPYAYRYDVPLAYDGRPLDTPEVAHAKAVHLATQAYEAARNTLGYLPAYVPAVPHVYTPAVSYGAPIGLDGQVLDTPEVAQAKAAHLAAHAQELAKTSGKPYGALAYALHPVYAYRFAHPAPLDDNGKVVDTPEVAEAKAAHLAAHAKETAKTSR